MKLRPRFSLRTLLLAVLTLGAATTLWWNWHPWRISRTYTGATSSCTTLEFSPDGKWIMAELSPEPYEGWLWNVESGQGRAILKTSPLSKHKTYRCYAAHFSRDSRYALFGMGAPEDGIYKLWDLKTDSDAMLQDFIPAGVSLQDIGGEYDVTISRDARYLLLRFGHEIRRLVDLETRSVKKDFEGIPVFFSGDPSMLVTRPNDGTTRFYDLSTLDEITSFSEYPGWVYNGFYRIGDRLFVQAIRTEFDFDDASGWALLDCGRPPYSDYSVLPGSLVSFSPDKTRVALLRENTIDIVNVNSHATISSLNSEYINSWVKWSNDGKWLLHIGEATLYEAQTGRKLFGVESSRGSALSHDSSRLVVGRYTGSYAVQLHDAADGRLLQTLPGQRLNYDGAFSPDDKNFLTQDADTHTIHLWTRHRPEPWYGLAYLPEFWLTLLLAPAALLSLLRDHKK